jgi:hypothetical protein
MPSFCYAFSMRSALIRSQIPQSPPLFKYQGVITNQEPGRYILAKSNYSFQKRQKELKRKKKKELKRQSKIEKKPSETQDNEAPVQGDGDNL